ncbi:MAG: hypothetical protein QOE44_966 [Solirubrobacteraceae bacterium]|nr:hypothetical protein [Solirubrobacteraceae bacterium]
MARPRRYLLGMTRTEADLVCAERNREDVSQPGVRWLVREVTPGDWGAVRVTIPGMRARGPLKTTTEARPRPEQAPDPRPPVNPNWGFPG